MTVGTIKRAGAAVATIITAAMIFGLVVFALGRVWPRRDPLPSELARKDEKVAAGAAQAIGADVDRRNADASINIDLVTKDIRDAFEAIPAVPVPPVGEPRTLPPAPVDRVRDRLNESVARANRAAGAAGTPD